jgi:hypothetical protein
MRYLNFRVTFSSPSRSSNESFPVRSARRNLAYVFVSPVETDHSY